MVLVHVECLVFLGVECVVLMHVECLVFLGVECVVLSACVVFVWFVWWVQFVFWLFGCCCAMLVADPGVCVLF